MFAIYGEGGNAFVPGTPQDRSVLFPEWPTLQPEENFQRTPPEPDPNPVPKWADFLRTE